MIIYEFWGMKRSGNHAILNWIIENIVDSSKEKNYINNDPHDFYCENLLVVNCYHEANYKKEILRIGLKQNPKYLIITYEDRKTDYSIFKSLNTHKFVILRNLSNLISSRMNYKHESIMTIQDEFFSTWENHVEKNYHKIYYDQWLVDLSYRDDVSALLNIKNKDITTNITGQGGGSSFIGVNLDTKENLLTRYKQVSFPVEIQEKLKYYNQKYPNFVHSLDS